VDARPRKIENYRRADGKEPYAIWFESIRRLPVGRKVAVRIDRAEDGNLGDHRFLGGGFGELRIDFGEGYRVCFGEDGDILVDCNS
jgi:putative addiction module killer protein